MSHAHDALHIVLNLHAGFLQSYEDDERTRMLRSYWLVYDTDEDIERLCRACEDLSGEARTKVVVAALELYQERIGMLLRMASNYVALPLRQIPTDLDAAEATITAFREEIATRLVNTQSDRVRRARGMLYAFYDYPTGVRFTYETMCELRGRVQYIIPDIGWAHVELYESEHVGDWLFAACRRLCD